MTVCELKMLNVLIFKIVIPKNIKVINNLFENLLKISSIILGISYFYLFIFQNVLLKNLCYG